MLRIRRRLRRVGVALGMAAALLATGCYEATTIVSDDEKANQEQVDDQPAEEEAQGEDENGEDDQGGE